MQGCGSARGPPSVLTPAARRTQELPAQGTLSRWSTEASCSASPRPDRVASVANASPLRRKMERPMSRGTTAAMHSSTQGRAHTRNASVKVASTPPTGPTVVSLFATNLKLLEFDLLPDWPGINRSSFGNHDARHRIRCTEFALFQLFKRYDPPTTADKLQPFYPPLEPLQSINLRAALYRCLNDLKKNGVLGKETVLRKTMLDECQGDKLWEVCLAFSSVVLRRRALERKSRYGKPIAERIGVAHEITGSRKASMLPLAIAHKASLMKILEEKQRKRETYARLYEVLVTKETELAQRKALALKHAQTRPSQAQLDALSAVEHNLDKRWVGSPQLKDIVVNGDASFDGGGVLTQPLDQLANTPSESMRASGPLDSLERKAHEQVQRVRRWQSMHEGLQPSKPASRQATRSDGDRGPLRFTKHRSLTMRDPSPAAREHSRQKSETAASVMRYDEILASMREELRRRRGAAASQPSTADGTQQQPKPQPQPQPPRKPSVHLDTSDDVPPRSPSQTAVPMRPGMGRPVSSRSRSYQQPKVESQRQPIPLKSGIFSPLKGGRRSSTSPITPSSLVASPIEEDPMSTGSHNVKTDSGVDLEFGDGKADITGDEVEDDGLAQAAQPDVTEVVSVPDHPPNAPPLPESKPDISRKGPRMSLADRTRMSMAFKSSEDMNGVLPEQPSSISATTAADDDQQEEESLPQELQQPLDRRASLLDRTRQSISLAPHTVPAKKKTTHSRSRTSIYPINQFETPPRKARSSSVTVDQSASKRDITPKEALFSPDADYDSIFKPRPKLAVSPKLSPFVDSGRPSMEMEGFLEEDVGRSSPLVGFGKD